MSKIVTGEQLRQDILNLAMTRKPLVEELLFERDIFMLTADSGAGKSIFATLLAACLSFKRPFLGMNIPEPKRVLYVQLEGDYEESIERLRYMEFEGGIFIEEKNLMWVEEKTLNVLDPASVQGFFQRINDTGFVPEVVIVDPIYKLSGEDISTGKAALGVINFSDKLYNKWNCTNVLIHHNVKESYMSDGKKMKKDDSFYGHSFIKNHIRTSYSMLSTGLNSREIIRKKGRGSDTRAKLSLEYNPETYVLNVSENQSPHKRGQHHERYFSFLAEAHKNRQNTCAQEIIDECEITYKQLRALKDKPETTELFTIKKTPPSNKEIWYPNLK